MNQSHESEEAPPPGDEAPPPGDEAPPPGDEAPPPGDEAPPCQPLATPCRTLHTHLDVCSRASGRRRVSVVTAVSGGGTEELVVFTVRSMMCIENMKQLETELKDTSNRTTGRSRQRSSRFRRFRSVLLAAP
ncbi:hypothetical protein EYF80_054678 [Liparis tanakae]|uniref:Uncharacterized protein n=1 Tax=Liparis tanakae TaxID=230148 RepID=A0A4Z2F1T1_9TELE|nr:hypothetical protein EYF80_054678 [Liparis tanakae]